MTGISQILFVDHSISNENGTIPATVTGLAKDLLCSNGNILNGLDFPMWNDVQWSCRQYATDMVAWNFLLGKVNGAPENAPYPTGHM